MSAHHASSPRDGNVASTWDEGFTRALEIGSITLALSAAPMAASLTDLSALLASIEVPGDILELVDCDLAHRLCDGSVLGDDLFDLLVRESVDLPAGGASQVQGLQFNPSDGYLVLFAAIAAHRQKHVFLSHGWPVLSLGSGIPSVTEAGGANNPVGGGASA